MTQRPRGTLLAPAELTDEQRALYDELCGGRRADAGRPKGPVDAEGRLTGPFNAMLYSPAVGMPLQRLGSALRYESRLDDAVRELVVLLVAGHHDSAYERFAHRRIALGLGLPDDLLDRVDRGETGDLPDGLHATAAPALELAARILRDDLPGEDDFARLRAALGEDGVFEINTLVGYYATLARQLELFGVAPAQGTLPEGASA